jgi:hypothetical protein
MAKRKAASRSKKTAARRSKSGHAGSQVRRAQSRPKSRRTMSKKSKKSKKTAKAARPRAARKMARPATRRAQSRPEPRRGTKKAAPKRPVLKSSRPKPPALDRERRHLDEGASSVSVPSTLNFDRKASSASSGRDAFRHQRRLHTEAGPAFTGGDPDANWEDGYSEGDEAPGGDNPTPDQDVVEEIGRALGVEYEDAEELKGADKITERDTNRWEYDPASAEDYGDRNKKE